LIFESSSAVTAKVKTRFGKSLNAGDYKKLLSCHSIAQVVSQLKSTYKYKEILKSINETSVHRRQLEQVLRQNLFEEFAVICRYEIGVTAHFSRFIVRDFEIQQIIHFLTLLVAGNHEDYILSLPSYFEKHTDIDLAELAKAQNYEEFLSALSKTPYQKLLRDFKPNEREILDLTKIEDILYIFIYQEMYDIIEEHAGKQEKAELTNIFDNIIDYNNLIRIIRLKKYYKMDKHEIKKFILPFGTLKESQINILCDSNSADDVVNIMKTFPQGKLIISLEYTHIGEIYLRARYNICRHNLAISTTPSVTAISYYFIMQTELLNIIKIVEGARYNFDREKLNTMLIY